MAWLLDTNILSELRRPRPEPKVVEFIERKPLSELYVSVVTISELRFGIELAGDPIRRMALSDWLASQVRPMFDSRILPITEDVMLTWRLLVEDGRKIGHTHSQPDLIIAATAIHFGHTIVTRDEKGYSRTGVAIINPWK